MCDDKLHMREGDPDSECDVCDWPTDGLAKRLIRAMRDRHPTGVNTCRDCVFRAKRDADEKRGK